MFTKEAPLELALSSGGPAGRGMTASTEDFLAPEPVPDRPPFRLDESDTASTESASWSVCGTEEDEGEEEDDAGLLLDDNADDDGPTCWMQPLWKKMTLSSSSGYNTIRKIQ